MAMPNQNGPIFDDDPYRQWQTDPEASLPAPCLPPKRRSFGQPGMACPARLYRGEGGLVDTVTRMEALAGCLVGAAPQADRGPGSMPAGYTYLGQLVVHDIAGPTFGKFPYVKPMMAMAMVRMAAPVPRPGLMLDSIFGARDDGLSPRGITRFSGSSADPGRPVAVDLDRRTDPEGGPDRAIVADPRNDDTPMLAQLCALFVLFRRESQRRLIPAMGPAAAAGSRALAVDVFHRILRKDLLARLLHPEVAAIYLRRSAPFVDPTAASPAAALPVEASNAVFRYGHAMVRPTYLLNDRSLPPAALPDLMAGLRGMEAGRRRNANLWRVDWRLFFGTGPQVQMARRLGPAVSPGLVERGSLPGEHRIGPELGNWKHDLALMDLARSVDGGLQRVAEIVGTLAPQFPGRGWAAFDPVARRALVTAWAAGAGAVPPPSLAEDPPLGLFTLIEAGAEGPGLGGGRTLGALGSVILAEVVLAEIARAQEALAREGHLRTARAALFGTGRLPGRMPAFIDLLSNAK